MIENAILLVDDDADYLRACSKWFVRRGFQVHAASDPQQALSIAAQQSIDVAVIDTSFQEMAGLDLLRQLQQFGDFPVTVLSGDNREARIQAALDRGAHQYMVKPVSLSVLEGAVRQCLARPRLDWSIPVRSASSVARKGEARGLEDCHRTRGAQVAL